MAQLPTLNYEYTNREVTDCFSGYRHQLKIEDGELFDSRNLTTAYYPLLANRKKRGLVCSMTAPGGLLAKEKLAWVDNGRLWYDGEETALTGLTSGEKQLVSMGAYICIFPDKKYYNTAEPADYGNMEAQYSSTGAVSYSLCQADGTAYAAPTASADPPANPNNAALWIDLSGETHMLKQWSSADGEWVSIPTVYTKLSFVSNGEIQGLFSEYDGVSISGSSVDEVNGEKVIYAVGEDQNIRDYIVVTGLLEEAVTQNSGSVKISRTVPDMDYVVECCNRLWGCKYGVSDGKNLNEIYCCALGDFKNWHQYMGLSTDSWTASVGSDGAWTGAVNYLGYPTFFKENRIHRVSVSSYGAHQISETVCRGVQRGSEKSLAVVNETLFYKSRADVCAYQGGFPVSVSEALGDEQYSDAAAGAVGDRYYIAMSNPDGLRQVFVYDIRRGIWMKEDELACTQFAAVDSELYALADNRLYAMTGSEGEQEAFVSWMAESGILGYQYPDRKYVSRYNCRIQMEEGAELEIFIQYDSCGEWERKGKIKFKGTNTVTVPIRPRRCDHLRIRLVGKGEFRLFSIARILSIGSDV